MNEPVARVLLVSDFHLGNLAGLLQNGPNLPGVQAETGPYGQVLPLLLDAGSPVWRETPDAALVWTRPEAVIPSFAELQGGTSVPMAVLHDEVDAYTEALRSAAERCGALLVPGWTRSGAPRGLGIGDLGRAGIRRALLEMNLRLASGLDAVANAFVLDTDRWLLRAGAAGHNPKFWYLGKIPFARPVFAEAALDVKAALRALRGGSRKLVVVDLDDTLWGGIVGEVGWQGLALGGHDALGEAFVDFQRELRALAGRGLLLAIASKNRESIALEALRKHPEMALRPEDFVAWRIDWNDKARNVADIAEQLNLGLQSVVFIDDNPAERARVREALPDVLVPEWPADRMLYTDALRALDCFDTTGISNEDRLRTSMMHSEQQRDANRARVGSLDAWLASIELVVTVEPYGDANRRRIVQLLNKTNQMNLATRRLSEAELEAWLAGGERRLWSFRVSDRFGDSGLCGIASVDLAGDARICDFVLSCRVFGRRVEDVMLQTVAEHAAAAGCAALRAHYVPTPRNAPCRDYLRGGAFEAAEDEHVFQLDPAALRALPDFIRVVRP